MKLSKARRRKIAARAAAKLRSKTVNFTVGKWIATAPRGGDNMSPHLTMKDIRAWLRERGLQHGNRECHVCLEGALLLSMADDPSIPDTAIGSTLLSEFQGDLCGLDLKDIGVNVNHTAQGIPELNDRILGRKPKPKREGLAVEILERASKS